MKINYARLIAKIVATAMLFGQGLYYAKTQPGLMDSFNGALLGIVLYVFWFAKDPQ